MGETRAMLFVAEIERARDAITTAMECIEVHQGADRSDECLNLSWATLLQMRSQLAAHSPAGYVAKTLAGGPR